MSGTEGAWGVWEFCPSDSYAVAFSSYYQPGLGSAGFLLKCNHTFKYEVSSTVGDKEFQTQFSPDCPSGLSGLQVRKSNVSLIVYDVNNLDQGEF